MSLNGLILVSGALDFASLSGDLSCQMFLPAYTAAAHFHQKLPPDLQADLPKALAEAREFMRTEYASALFQGASLTAAERARVVAKLSRLTGLPARVVEDNDLRDGQLDFPQGAVARPRADSRSFRRPHHRPRRRCRHRAIRDLTLRCPRLTGLFRPP